MSQRRRTQTKNKENPLYVVKGNIVEEAQGRVDALIKKWGLDPLIEIIKEVQHFLLTQVKGLAVLDLIQDLMDQFLKMLKSLSLWSKRYVAPSLGAKA